MASAPDIARGGIAASAPNGASTGDPDDLVGAIRRAIRAGDFVPGQRLVEADLCAQFNATRAKVREAFRRLEADGIIVVQPNRGASVRALSRKDIERLYEIREMLEGLAARLSARAAASDAAARRALTEARANLQTAADAGNISDYMERNAEFHSLLVTLSGNAFIGPMLDRIMLPTFRMQFYIAMTRDVIGDSHGQHIGILDALLRGDETAAEDRMRAHVRTSLSLIRSIPDRFFKQD